jgi:DNA topoisomerase-3
MSSSLPVVMMVAEKPSICNSIAVALSGGLEHCNSRGRTPPVHEFPGTFLGKKCLYRVTSVTGHVFSTDFPKEYQDWESIAPSELFQAPVLSIPTRGSIVSLLKNEGRGIDSLVLWLDCDREGENICFEVIRCVKSVMSSRKGRQIYRAKFSAVNREDIVKAMSCLGVPNKAESDAVDARQELDLKVGVAFSRFQTLYFQGRYADLDARCISYGPCQSPTLGFCVRRHLEISHFQAEPYWILQVNVMSKGIDGGGGGSGGSGGGGGGGGSESADARGGGSRSNNNHTPLALEWERGKCFDQNVCRTFYERVHVNQTLIVQDVQTREMKQSRPTPMNTVQLLKVASKALGIGPHDTMRAAENLYLRGYLSYPRTESTAYPKSFDIANILKQLQSHDAWGYYVQNLLQNGGYTKPKGGVDMGDHPPITPCRLAQPYELSGSESRIYDLVARHFVATVSPDAIYLRTKVQFKGAEEMFHLSARVLIDPGFLEIQRRPRRTEANDGGGGGGGDGVEEEKKLPSFQKGEVVEIIGAGYNGDAASEAIPRRCSLSMKALMTKPPDYLTESELIGLMERNGIGTDASIPTHINNISKRNYVKLVKNGGRRLVPTRLGIVLVQGYLRIDPDLILPKIRSNIEDQCSLIASGAATKEDVVEHSLKHFLLKFNYFCNNISRMVKFMVVVVVVGDGGGGCCCKPMPVSNLETMFDY